MSVAAKARYYESVRRTRREVEELRDRLRVAEQALAELERSKDDRIAYYEALYEDQP
jgi:hypothetical protein